MGISFLSVPEVSAPYCWLAMLEGAKLGVHLTDGWCMQIGKEIIYFDAEKKITLLTSILEIDEDTVFRSLAIAKTLRPEYAEAIDRFPLTLLLKHIFHTSYSGYWPEKALSWVRNRPDVLPHIKDELLTFSKNSSMPQKSRQIARKLLQQF